MLDPNEPGKSPLTDQSLGRLLKDIYTDVDYFNVDNLGKYQEPDRFPTFDTSFLPAAVAQGNLPAATNASPTIRSNSSASGSPMTTIRVDPPVLQNCSNDIRASVSTLRSVTGNLNSCANGAPSYDGQFGPKVRAIVGEPISRGGHLSGMFDGLAGTLWKKAQQFLDVDNASLGAIGGYLSSPGWPTLPSGLFPSLTLLPFWDWINKLFPKGIFPWNQTPGNIVTPGSSTTVSKIHSAVTSDALNLRTGAGLGNFRITTIPKGTTLEVLEGGVVVDGLTWVKVRTSDGQVGWVAENYLIPAQSTAPNVNETPQKPVTDVNYQPTGMMVGEGFFTSVPADGPDNGYWRKGFDKTTNSDCTWYAAEAVKKASNGKVDLSKIGSWGPATNWASNAASYAQNHPGGIVQGVSKEPVAGDVMALHSGGGGHVAFVEKVLSKNQDGSYTIVISEESAGEKLPDGSYAFKCPNWKVEKNISNVVHDGRNLRWRKTITINPNDSGGTDVNFIHFNYGNSSIL